MAKRLLQRYLVAALAAAGVAALAACGSSSMSPSGTANLKVMLTDSPFTDATALVVTFSEVSAHTSGGGWVTLPFSGGGASQSCDLKRLQNGANDVLGVGALAAGHYTGIRLTVSSATVYFTATSTQATPCAPALTLSSTTDMGSPVTVASGQLFLNRQFDLGATGTAPTTMMLDFNGNASMAMMGTGMYQMTPVITVVSVQ